MAILLKKSEDPIVLGIKSIGFARILLLLLLLGITWGGYFHLHEQEKKFAELDFNAKIADLETTLKLRIKNYEEMLLGVAGLYEASKSVEREEFQAYINGLHLDTNYVGVQGVGYAQWLAPDYVDEYIEGVRSQGFPEFTLKPPGLRDNYSIIVYLEPFSGRNLAAFGYDMYADPIRRAAMDHAVINNSTSLSSKVTLVQETDKDVQAGILMYLPVYKKNRPLNTVAQRWDALDGFAYSPFRANDLINAMIKDRNIEINFSLYTSVGVDPQQKIYSTIAADNTYQAKYYRELQITVFGQPWTLTITSTPQHDSQNTTYIDEILLLLGSVSCLLLFFLFCAMAAQRQSALLLAQSMSQDVHEKNRQLQFSEERFQLALKSSAMGVWSWNLVDNFVHWDDSMYELFGLPAMSSRTLTSDGAVIPASITSLDGATGLDGTTKSNNSYDIFLQHVHSDDRDRVLNELAAAVKGHADYETEYRVVWGDLSVHHIASRAKIIFDDYGVAISMIGTCWDIDERKRLEQLKTDFVATVSHELRIPLTAINGALGLAVNGSLGVLPEEAQVALDIAYKSSQRLTLLINDLLDMDKLLAGKVEFHCETQAVWPLVERAVMDSQAYADQFQVKFVVAAINPTYKIRVESVRFLQAVAKLLANAAKFSSPQAEVLVTVSSEEGWVRIAVTDQGVGISNEAKNHIFDKFYQADSSSTRAKGGAGLGLSIAKELVERMQGRVGFVSEVGMGSQFYVEFPLVTQEL